MTIDIIDLTDPDYADLDPVQLSMVRTAQTKKNNIVAKADAAVKELFYLLLGKDNVRSHVRTREETRIREQEEADIDAVREDLLQQLAYQSLGSEGNELGPYRYPENPNYNLTYSQRFLVVRDYYMHVTTNPEARLEAFGMDSLARTYLGEFYQTLYEQLASYVR